MPVLISLILFVSGSLTNIFISYAIFSAGLSLFFFGIKKYRTNPSLKIKDSKAGLKQRM
jgi:multisubunit Na+/H+ antiporter MnhC subunit